MHNKNAPKPLKSQTNQSDVDLNMVSGKHPLFGMVFYTTKKLMPYILVLVIYVIAPPEIKPQIASPTVRTLFLKAIYDSIMSIIRIF